jgi:putative PIN family toxin of toxin-antitoxin system
VQNVANVRAVIDTNVLLSGLLWRGVPHVLLEQVRNGKIQLISSPALLSELAEVINRPKFDDILVRSDTSRINMLHELQQLADVVAPSSSMQPVCRDADDDEVLAVAIASQADCIITGDDDLLSLKTFQDIPIITPDEAVKILAVS